MYVPVFDAVARVHGLELGSNCSSASLRHFVQEHHRGLPNQFRDVVCDVQTGGSGTARHSLRWSV